MSAQVAGPGDVAQVASGQVSSDLVGRLAGGLLDRDGAADGGELVAAARMDLDRDAGVVGSGTVGDRLRGATSWPAARSAG